jgi:hypothetical protein
VPRKPLAEQRATRLRILAYCDAEHIRLFGEAWEPDRSRELLDYGAATPRGSDIDDPDDPVPRRRADRARSAADAELDADRLRMSRAFDALRRHVLNLGLLADALEKKWGPSPDESADTADYHQVEHVMVRDVRRLLRKMPKEVLQADWRADRAPTAHTIIARKAPSVYGRELTNDELGVVSLLCTNRPTIHEHDVVKKVVEREADAMRRARERLKLGQ